jgi:hypothetical protein
MALKGAAGWGIWIGGDPLHQFPFRGFCKEQGQHQQVDALIAQGKLQMPYLGIPGLVFGLEQLK